MIWLYNGSKKPVCKAPSSYSIVKIQSLRIIPKPLTTLSECCMNIFVFILESSCLRHRSPPRCGQRYSLHLRSSSRPHQDGLSRMFFGEMPCKDAFLMIGLKRLFHIFHQAIVCLLLKSKKPSFPRWHVPDVPLHRLQVKCCLIPCAPLKAGSLKVSQTIEIPLLDWMILSSARMHAKRLTKWGF